MLVRLGHDLRRTSIPSSYSTILLIALSAPQVQAQFLTFPLADNTIPVYNGWLYRDLKKHEAVDYRAPVGTTVMAAADGLAIASCQPPLTKTDLTQPDTYGQFILIDHQNGYSTLYAHLSSVFVPPSAQLPCDDRSRFAIRRGDISYGGQVFQWAPIRRGQLVAAVGETGTTYYHLHFESSVNPTGNYETHVINRRDSYSIYKSFQFYPPPIGKCANINQPAYLWTTCPPSLLSMNDDFNANTLNTTLWTPQIPPPTLSGSALVSNQRFEISIGPGAGGLGIASKCSVGGDFDVQADFGLLTWPTANTHSLLVRALDFGVGTFGGIDMSRHSSAFFGEAYVAVFPSTFAQAPTTDTNGKLRLVRTGSTLAGYFWNGTSWVSVGSGTVPSVATRISLELGTGDPRAPAASGFFDNFKVNAGAITCPP